MKMLSGYLVAAILFGALPGCGGRDTYYPVNVCSSGCDNVNDFGTFRRFRTADSPQRFTASVERQDVVRESNGGIESLTRNLEFTCVVRTPRDWECQHELIDPKRWEKYTMTEGELAYVLSDALYFPNETTVYDPYCEWKQIQVHNQTSREADDFTPRVAKKPGRLEFAWYMLSGCDSSLPVPWGYVALEALPPWMAVLIVGIG